VGDGDECVLVSLHTNALHQPQPQPPIQRDAQPQAIVLKLHNIRVGIRQTETGAQQFAFSDSALGDLEFASTLVESISDSTLISRIRVFSCTDESLPKSLALPRPTGRLPLFLCLDRRAI